MLISVVTTVLLKQTCYQMRLQAALGGELGIGIRRRAKSKLAASRPLQDFGKLIRKKAGTHWARTAWKKASALSRRITCLGHIDRLVRAGHSGKVTNRSLNGSICRENGRRVSEFTWK